MEQKHETRNTGRIEAMVAVHKKANPAPQFAE